MYSSLCVYVSVDALTDCLLLRHQIISVVDLKSVKIHKTSLILGSQAASGDVIVETTWVKLTKSDSFVDMVVTTTANSSLSVLSYKVCS